jgi:anti-sigma B factor antagonist
MTTVCRVVGDLDARSVVSFREGTALVARAGDPAVLDLTEVGFIDSVGLGALVGVVRRCHDAQLAVACCARPAVAAALRCVGFDRLAPVAATIEDAVAWLATQAPAKDRELVPA